MPAYSRNKAVIAVPPPALLLLLLLSLTGPLQGQTPRPQSISLVAFPSADVMFTYDLNEDPWLLQAASWAIDLPSDGTCVIGYDGTGYALTSLQYINYAEYDEEDGVIDPASVGPTSSQPIWVASVQANCNNNPALPAGCTYLFDSLSTDGTEGSWCGEYYAFRLVNRECSLTLYESDQFTDVPLVVEWEYLPLIQTLDADLKAAGLTMDVQHSVRRVGQELKGVVYKKASNSAHLVGHAFDFKLHCETCSATDGPATCNKACLRKLYRAKTAPAKIPSDFFTFMKGGSHVGSPGHAGPLRWGALYGDWIHLDDNNYFYSHGAQQQTTFNHTWLRVQSQLQLMCGGGMCAAPKGQPQLSLSDLQSTICTGTGVFSVKTTTPPPPPPPSLYVDDDDDDDALDEANDALGALVAQGVLNSTQLMVSGLTLHESLQNGAVVPAYLDGVGHAARAQELLTAAYSGWVPTRLTGSNPSTKYNLTGPVYQPASALTGLTLEDLSDFTVDNSTAGSWTITFSAPDTASNFLAEVQQLLQAPRAKPAATSLLNYTTAINLTSATRATTLLQANSLVNLSSTWNASLTANNLSSFSANASYPDGSGLAPLLLLQLSSNSTATVPFSYAATGTLYSTTIEGTLTFNTTSVVSAYAFLAGCYPLLAINASRVITVSSQQQQAGGSTSFLGSAQRIVRAGKFPTSFSYTALPDECLYLLPGQSTPISAGGWNLTLDASWTDPFGRGTQQLGLRSVANGSLLTLQESNAATPATASRSLGEWSAEVLTVQGVVLFNQSGAASSSPKPTPPANAASGVEHSPTSALLLIAVTILVAVVW